MSDGLQTTSLVVVALAAFIGFRLWPVWPTRRRGCDAYYFLLTAESLRKQRRLPIQLPPYFLLEGTKQYYPPGFSLLLSVLPPTILRRWHWLINHVFDGLVALGLGWWTTTVAGPSAGILAVVLYASSPFLVMEFSGLTSRSLAAPIFAAELWAASWWVVEGKWFALVLATVLVTGILYTHKLTTQLLWFLFPFLAIVQFEPSWLVPLASGYVLAVAIGWHFFARLQAAHLDIVRFWSRNWRYLGAHQVRNSPIYGDGEPASSYHRGSGLALVGLHVRRILQYNPWLVPLGALVAVEAPAFADPWEQTAAAAVAGIVAWALLTTLVPGLRGFGEGTKYLKYAQPPSLALVVTQLWANPTDQHIGVMAAAAFAVLMQGVLYAFVSRDLRGKGAQASGIEGADVDPILAHIADVPEARVLCLPTQMADLVAYATRRRVLWGTHHLGFACVEPFFPVIRKPIEEFVREYGLTHLLLDIRFAAPEELRIATLQILMRSGPYVLCNLEADALQEGGFEERPVS